MKRPVSSRLSSRLRLRYADVMSTIAVFLALGGSAYAVARIDGSELKNRSVPGEKIQRNALGGREISERRLRRVQDAARLGGQPAEQFLGSRVTIRTQPFQITQFGGGIGPGGGATARCHPGEQVTGGSVSGDPGFTGGTERGVIIDDGPTRRGMGRIDDAPAVGWRGFVSGGEVGRTMYVYALCSSVGGR